MARATSHGVGVEEGIAEQGSRRQRGRLLTTSRAHPPRNVVERRPTSAGRD
jgi:hypothetical protein